MQTVDTNPNVQCIESINDFVVKFANVNGTGSASANALFAKAVFRMGVPVSPRNIFPSNIQGLPTWYEVRISEDGHISRRGGVDVMLAMNPQTMAQDVAEIDAGGFFIYDSTKQLAKKFVRDDLTYLGIPLTDMCINEFGNIKQRQLFKNICYVGALCALLNMEFEVFEELLKEQFRSKEKLIEPNVRALKLGYDYAKEHFGDALKFQVQRSNRLDGKILIDGNSALALGAVFGGATVAGWYPITPSTSVVENFAKWAEKYRIDPETGAKNFAIVQAEDELSAIGIAIGANWNGARAFTATSGPGISLMTEFLGLAYFAEIPLVLVDIQRGGPSTGLPTRTQQSDLLACAYASHGDTKHVLLFPSSPAECFEFGAKSFDLAERLQTPIIILSDLDLGMNEWCSDAFTWDDEIKYDRGKVLNKEQLDQAKDWGRYRDVDNDGIGYRTYPGTHPSKGAFFTRGTSHDPYAKYTESGAAYVENMERLDKKFDTAKKIVPAPLIHRSNVGTEYGVIYFGSTEPAMHEALFELMHNDRIYLDALRVRSFPFSDDVFHFIEDHRTIFVVEQNRDAQLRTMLINEGNLRNPHKLVSVLHYDGTPICERFISGSIRKYINPMIHPINTQFARRAS